MCHQDYRRRLSYVRFDFVSCKVLVLGGGPGALCFGNITVITESLQSRSFLVAVRMHTLVEEEVVGGGGQAAVAGHEFAILQPSYIFFFSFVLSYFSYHSFIHPSILHPSKLLSFGADFSRGGGGVVMEVEGVVHGYTLEIITLKLFSVVIKFLV